jgi:hypothetical protein
MVKIDLTASAILILQARLTESLPELDVSVFATADKSNWL